MCAASSTARGWSLIRNEGKQPAMQPSVQLNWWTQGLPEGGDWTRRAAASGPAKPAMKRARRPDILLPAQAIRGCRNLRRSPCASRSTEYRACKNTYGNLRENSMENKMIPRRIDKLDFTRCKESTRNLNIYAYY